MDERQMEMNRRKFWELLDAAAGKRKGYEEFKEWLESTDFFRAPASIKHHGNYAGGLAQHSLNVCRRLCERDKSQRNDSATITALLHDVCKTDTYLPKDMEEGEVKSWKYNSWKRLPVGHGERSVILIQQHGLTLTMEEITAIRWHMGAWDDAVRGGSRELDAAIGMYPLVLQLQIADMEATHLDERGDEDAGV